MCHIELDYHRPSIYSNYKIPLATNRSNQIAKTTNPPLSSNASNFKPLPLSHVECISSDEEQIVDSENEVPYVFDGGKSSKLYGRSSHRSAAAAAASSSSSKKEKRQSRRNKVRTGINSGGDRERCLLHGKRRCIDFDCTVVDVSPSVSRKKRVRHKYDSDRKAAKSKYSSDSEEELLRNREELKMALNIIDPSARTVSTTLSHKLSAIQNQHQLDDGKKSSVKPRKRKNSHSPDRDASKRSKHTQKSNTKTEPHRKPEQVKTKTSKPPAGKVKHQANAAHDEDEDEHISLEEQELRLIALKSAVLKKHEARKRKQLATIVQTSEQIARPYSPTDSIVLVTDEAGEPGESGDRSNDCQNDSDSNNMDISPISSPTNQYQPMDMDLVSSNENSKSPIFSYEKPQTFPPFDSFIDWGNVHIPVPINAAAAVAAAAFVDIDQAACALSQPFTLQPTYSLIYDDNIPKEPIPVENAVMAIPSDAKENEPNDNEADELRAKLIEQMRATTTMLPPDDAIESKYEAKPVPTSGSDIVARPKDGGTSNVDSLEEDCLRSLLLSSKGKKSNILKETTNEPHAPLEPSLKSNEITASKSCDDIPKLTLNLREALKRLKSNQQNKNLAASSNKKVPPIGPTHEDENANKHVKSLQNCDHNEIQKTVVNKRVDDKGNDQKIVEQLTDAAAVPSTDDIKVVESTNETKMEVETVTNIPNESAKKPTTASPTIPVKAKPLSIQTPLTEQKTGSSDARTTVAPASKTTEKLVTEEEPIKKMTNQQPAKKPAAIPKPKLTNESPPPVTSAPLRPKSFTPPIPSRAMGISKMESIRRTSGSPVIATWVVKPVKKLIISLNEDSSTDTDDTENSTNKKTAPASNTFQVRLDQFLQSVRASTVKTTAVKEQSTKPSTIKKTTTPKAAAKKDSPQKNQVMSCERTNTIHQDTPIHFVSFLIKYRHHQRRSLTCQYRHSSNTIVL